MHTKTRKRRTAAALQKRARMTLHEAAEAFEVPRRTLARRLRSHGLEVGDGELYAVAEIHEALMGSLEAERIQETRERRKLLTLERQEKERDLAPLAEVSVMIRDSFLPVRQRLMALPSEMAARCNPSDPQLAREALDRWLTESLPIIRAGLPQRRGGAVETNADGENVQNRKGRAAGGNAA